MTEVRLSISVMAFESRAEFFPYLTQRLGDVPFSIDKAGPENIGVWRNCRRAWRMVEPGATHHVVIQDDAVIGSRFKERAEELIRRTSAERLAYQFYVGGRKAVMGISDEDKGRGFIINRTLWWGVAICLPVDLIEPMIAFGDNMKIKQDDMRIRAFLKATTIRTCYSLPCLIDHRTGLESLVGDPGRNRHSFNFIGEYEN